MKHLFLIILCFIYFNNAVAQNCKAAPCVDGVCSNICVTQFCGGTTTLAHFKVSFPRDRPEYAVRMCRVAETTFSSRKGYPSDPALSDDSLFSSSAIDLGEICDPCDMLRALEDLAEKMRQKGYRQVTEGEVFDNRYSWVKRFKIPRPSPKLIEESGDCGGKSFCYGSKEEDPPVLETQPPAPTPRRPPSLTSSLLTSEPMQSRVQELPAKPDNVADFDPEEESFPRRADESLTAIRGLTVEEVPAEIIPDIKSNKIEGEIELDERLKQVFDQACLGTPIQRKAAAFSQTTFQEQNVKRLLKDGIKQGGSSFASGFFSNIYSNETGNKMLKRYCSDEKSYFLCSQIIKKMLVGQVEEGDKNPDKFTFQDDEITFKNIMRGENSFAQMNSCADLMTDHLTPMFMQATQNAMEAEKILEEDDVVAKSSVWTPCETTELYLKKLYTELEDIFGELDPSTMHAEQREVYKKAREIRLGARSRLGEIASHQDFLFFVSWMKEEIKKMEGKDKKFVEEKLANIIKEMKEQKVLINVNGLTDSDRVKSVMHFLYEIKGKGSDEKVESSAISYSYADRAAASRPSAKDAVHLMFSRDSRSPDFYNKIEDSVLKFVYPSTPAR